MQLSVLERKEGLLQLRKTHDKDAHVLFVDL